MVTFTIGAIAILAAVCLAIGGMLIVRRKFDVSELRMHHDVADPLLSVVGTLFSILLGFLVAGAISRFDEARLNVQEEAGALADVVRTAVGLPDPVRIPIQENCLKYAELVVNQEWHAMEKKESSQAAWDAYGNIWTLCAKFQPVTQGEGDIHQAILAAICRLGNYRTLRFAAMNNQLPAGMWLVVLMGGGATIIFTYFFEVKSEKIQMLMTGLVAMVMALNIFLLANYDYPFSGDVRVSRAAFDLDLTTFHKYLGEAAHTHKVD